MKKYVLIISLIFIIINFYVLHTSIISFQIITNNKNHNKNIHYNILQKVKNDIYDADKITPIITKDRFNPDEVVALYEIHNKKHDLIGFVAMAYKTLRCDVCKDVRILLVTDQDGKIIILKSMNKIKINKNYIDPSDFLNQFVGKKRVDIQDLTYNIHNINGATYSAEAIIELVDYVLNIIHGSLIKKR